MSLTDQDLTAIKAIVSESAEKLDIHMAEGFGEVYKHISMLKDDVLLLKQDVGLLHQTVGRIEFVQQQYGKQLENHTAEIKSLRKSLRIA